MPRKWQTITREEVSKIFHLPIAQAAEKLNVCVSILKRICRNFGIPRWPYRKFRSLDRGIEDLRSVSEFAANKTSLPSVLPALAYPSTVCGIMSQPAPSVTQQQTTDVLPNLMFSCTSNSNTTSSTMKLPVTQAQAAFQDPRRLESASSLLWLAALSSQTPPLAKEPVLRPYQLVVQQQSCQPPDRELMYLCERFVEFGKRHHISIC